MDCEAGSGKGEKADPGSLDPAGSQSRFIRRYQSSSKVIRIHKYPLSLLKPTKVHPFPPEFSKAYCFLMKEDNLDPNGS